MTREEALAILNHNVSKCLFGTEWGEALDMAIKALEQEPQTFKWCHDCKEHDEEKHCCHRWSKVIRDTVAELKQEYIEREVIDEIRDKIIEKYWDCDICKWKDGYCNKRGDISDILKIIDKYK